MLFKSNPKYADFETEFVLFVDEVNEDGRTSYLIQDGFPVELPVDFDYGIELSDSGGYYFKSTSGAKYLNWIEE